jgi:hypothetical protein
MATATKAAQDNQTALGVSLATFGRHAPHKRITVWIAAGLCFAGGMLAYHSSQMERLGGFGLMLAGGFVGWLAYKSAGQKIELCANGVRVTNREKLLFETTWQQVSYSHEQMEAGDFCGITLFKNEESKYRFFEPDIAKFIKLRDALQEAVDHVVQTRVQKAFRLGHPFEFDGLVVTPKALLADDLAVKWSDVEIVFDRIYMTIRKRGTGGFLDAGEVYWKKAIIGIPNFSLLLGLMKHFGVKGAEDYGTKDYLFAW